MNELWPNEKRYTLWIWCVRVGCAFVFARLHASPFVTTQALPHFLISEFLFFFHFRKHTRKNTFSLSLSLSRCSFARLIISLLSSIFCCCFLFILMLFTLTSCYTFVDLRSNFVYFSNAQQNPYILQFNLQKKSNCSTMGIELAQTCTHIRTRTRITVMRIAFIHWWYCLLFNSVCDSAAFKTPTIAKMVIKSKMWILNWMNGT